MRRLLRLTVMSFFCTVIVVMAGALREQLTERRVAGVEAQTRAAKPVATKPILASARVQASTLDASSLGAPSLGLFEMRVFRPDPVPEVVVLEEPEPLPWAPPEWFPEDDIEALLAVDAISNSPDGVGPDLGLKSRAVFVYDLEAGKALLARNADDRRPVASLTKVVSALTVASESPDLDAEVCLDASTRPSWPGAVSKLRNGTCTTGWDLLGAALVRSDNGAAIALSRVAGLPHYPFIDRMNVVAADLGMDQSTFSDPSGVEDDNLSTARDMTRAVVAASLHPTVHPVASAPYWDLTDNTRNKTRRLYTTNKLVARSGTDILAAKTGYTDTARHCFTGVFRLRDGRKVALTVLGGYWSRHRWSDINKILAWIERGAPGAGEAT
jgi:D-alanyl-D-alanine endopeptidase (penicillin-binding protein 7)